MRAMILLLALLTGCADLQAGNAAGGVVSGGFSTSAAFRAADEHCAKYGKQALMGGLLNTAEYSFACVPR